MKSPRTTTLHTTHLNPQRLRPAAVSLAALASATLLAGCASTLTSSPSEMTGGTALVRISGSVHGGQQPVVGATIQLYTVGTSGLKSASTALLTSTVVTDATGSFSLTGKYSCSSATQVYLTATGGNPGSGTNAALSMAAALGACSSLTPSTFTSLNEVTTVAAAWSLAPFATDLTHIGAAGANATGLANAFTNANVLANTTTGLAGGTLQQGVAVPTAEINTLADILAACVNTTGATSSPCASLFSATGASDTFGAALAMARTPGLPAITNLFSLLPAAAPFQPTLTAAPSDFALAITMAGSGGNLSTPFGIAIDASGNAWVTNESNNLISQFAVDGRPIGNQAAAGLIGAQGIAIDRAGDVWVANTGGNSVVKFGVNGIGTIVGSTVFTGGGLLGPVSIALDSNANAWVANLNSDSVTALNSTGTPLSGSPFYGINSQSAPTISVPSGIAVGPTGFIYVTSGLGSVVKLSNAGAWQATLTDSALQGPFAVEVDSSSRVAATGYVTGTAVSGAVSQFTSAGTPIAVSPSTNGLANPAGIASDGTTLFIANNLASGGLAQITAGSNVQLSSGAGYGSLANPVGVAVDNSGSVWTTNSGNNTVSKFVGLAVPVVTPLAANVGP